MYLGGLTMDAYKFNKVFIYWFPLLFFSKLPMAVIGVLFIKVIELPFCNIRLTGYPLDLLLFFYRNVNRLILYVTTVNRDIHWLLTYGLY